MSNANPSVDPANEDTLTGTFRHVFGKMLQDVNGMLPAQVVAFDRTTNRVQVQPMIAVLSTNGESVTRAPVASIPVLQIGGGGYILNFNLNTGDLGWILANDRDISLFLQNYQNSNPNTDRKADFADSLFIPDVMKGYTIASEDAANAVLQNLDGTVRISLWPDKVKITAPTVEVNGDLLVDGLVTCTALTVNGTGTDVNITGDVFVTGDISATGNITAHV